MKRTGATIGGAIAVVVSLATVALASRGDPGDRTAAAFEGAAVGRTIFLSVLGIAFLLSAVLALWALWPDGSGRAKPAPRSRWLPYLLIAALILVLAQFAPERPSGRVDRGEDAAAAPESEDDEGAAPLSGRASPTASLALTALAVGALAVFTLALRRRRDAPGDEGDGDGEDGERPPAIDATIASAIDAGDLDGAIAAVAAEPDPQRAVLLAYAVLDAHLAGTPAARVRTSTPHEWLQRIRQVHGEAAPATVDAARRLTSLYERARFGEEHLEPRHRDEAVVALRSLPSRATEPQMP